VTVADPADAKTEVVEQILARAQQGRAQQG
jgi:hypothetical protein